MNRDRFVGAVLCKETGSASVAYLLCFAKQRPYSATFLQLVRQESIMPAIERVSLDEQVLHQLRHDEYQYLPLVFKEEKEVPFDDDDELFAIAGARFVGDKVVMDHPPELFELFTAWHLASYCILQCI